MALDFRADQLQVEKIIGVGTDDKILVLPQSSTTDTYGGIPTALSASLASPEIFFYVSGGIDSKASGSFGTSVFGGDVVFSGSVYIEGTISGSGLGGGGSSDQIINATSDTYIDADPNDDGSDKTILMYSNGVQIGAFSDTLLTSSVSASNMDMGYKIGDAALLGFFDAPLLFSKGPTAQEHAIVTTLGTGIGGTTSAVQSMLVAGDLSGDYALSMALREAINAGVNQRWSVTLAAGSALFTVEDTDDSASAANNRVKLSGDEFLIQAPANFDSSIRNDVRETTGNITASISGDHILLVNASTGPKSIVLPIVTESLYTGINYVIKDVAGTSSLNNITVQSENTASYKIDGADTYVLNSDYASITVIGRSSGDWTII